MTPSVPVVHLHADLEALSRAAADHVVAVVEAVLEEQERFVLALGGGGTPRRLYELLAGPYRSRIPWPRLVFCWGDERFVPPDHPASNYRMARETLLDPLVLSPAQIFPIPTDRPPPAAAAAYEATLRRLCAGRTTTFDLALLGLGDDGHTASLFSEEEPSAGSGEESAPWVAAVTAPPRYEVRDRLTVTLPALNRSRQVAFLVAGADKRPALRGVLDRQDPALPAAHVRAREALTWFVDTAAHGEDDAG